MTNIKNVKIENDSKWSMNKAVENVAWLMNSELEFIQKNRNNGCGFNYSNNVRISILPICEAAQDDTLHFFLFDYDTRS